MQRVSEFIFTYLLKFAPYHADGIEYWRAFRRALQILDKLMQFIGVRVASSAGVAYDLRIDFGRPSQSRILLCAFIFTQHLPARLPQSEA